MTLKDKYYADGKIEHANNGRYILNDDGCNINSKGYTSYTGSKKIDISEDKLEVNLSRSQEVTFGSLINYSRNRESVADYVSDYGLNLYEIMGGASNKVRNDAQQAIYKIIQESRQKILQFLEYINPREEYMVTDTYGEIGGQVTPAISATGDADGLDLGQFSIDDFGLSNNIRLKKLLNIFAIFNDLYDELENDISNIMQLFKECMPVSRLTLGDNGLNAQVVSVPDKWDTSPYANFFIASGTPKLTKVGFQGSDSQLVSAHDNKPIILMAAHNLNGFGGFGENVSQKTHIMTMQDCFLVDSRLESRTPTAIEFDFVQHKSAYFQVGSFYGDDASVRFGVSGNYEPNKPTESHVNATYLGIEAVSREIKFTAIDTSRGNLQPISLMRMRVEDGFHLSSPQGILITRKTDKVLRANESGVFINSNFFVKSPDTTGPAYAVEGVSSILSRFKTIRDKVQARLNVLPKNNCCPSHIFDENVVESPVEYKVEEENKIWQEYIS